MNIQLPHFIIAGLYKNALVVLDEAANPVEAEATTATAEQPFY